MHTPHRVYRRKGISSCFLILSITTVCVFTLLTSCGKKDQAPPTQGDKKEVPQALTPLSSRIEYALNEVSKAEKSADAIIKPGEGSEDVMNAVANEISEQIARLTLLLKLLEKPENGGVKSKLVPESHQGSMKDSISIGVTFASSSAVFFTSKNPTSSAALSFPRLFYTLPAPSLYLSSAVGISAVSSLDLKGKKEIDEETHKEFLKVIEKDKKHANLVRCANAVRAQLGYEPDAAIANRIADQLQQNYLTAIFKAGRDYDKEKLGKDSKPNLVALLKKELEPFDDFPRKLLDTMSKQNAISKEDAEVFHQYWNNCIKVGKEKGGAESPNFDYPKVRKVLKELREKLEEIQKATASNDP